MNDLKGYTYVLSFVILNVLLVSGCYSTKPGYKVGQKRLEKEKLNDSVNIDAKISYPGDERVRFTVKKRYKYRVKYAEKSLKLRKRSDIIGWISYSAGMISTSVGLRISALCDEREECTDVEQKEARGKLIKWGVPGTALIAAGIFQILWANEDDTYDSTDEYVYGDEFARTMSGSSKNLENEQISLMLNGQKKQYTTDSEGQFTIDMTEDFDLRTLEQPTLQRATIILPERGDTYSVSVNPKEWMVPYARIRESAQMREQDFTASEALQTAKRGEELRITNEKSDWFQVRRSGETGWIPSRNVERFWAVPTRLDPNRPPSVTASVSFSEPSGNNRLDADERATVQVTARNEGEGPAHRVRALVSPKSRTQLSYPQSIDFGRAGARQSKTKSIQIEAGREVPSEKVALTFRFQEANGFAPSPVKLQFETREFIPPELTIADVGIDDASGNGVIEAGEVVEVTTRIRNQSRGQAKGVEAQVNFEGENVFAGPNTQQAFDLGDLGPGERQDIQFNLLTSQQAESVPVTVDLSEKYGEFGKSGVKLPLQFDTPTDQITEVQVEGQDTEVAVKTGDQLSVDVETNIPSTPMKRPNSIAVVIGIQSYAAEGAPDVEYARRDTRYVREYLTQTLGFREENILPRDPDGRMTFAEMRTLIQEKLPSYVKEGTSEVFVYYSGHGAPSTGESKNAYLVPSDTDPNFVSDANAYRLSSFYEDLATLSAESVTVALDACFTGQAGSGEMMLRQASPLALSVENPLLGINDATGFLASGPEQVANWYPEKKHGMFTYFFLKGLKGEADLNRDRAVTVKEMKRYLTNESSGVPYWSRRVHQRKQVPQVVTQSPNRVLVRLGDS